MGYMSIGAHIKSDMHLKWIKSADASDITNFHNNNMNKTEKAEKEEFVIKNQPQRDDNEMARFGFGKDGSMRVLSSDEEDNDGAQANRELKKVCDKDDEGIKDE